MITIQKFIKDDSTPPVRRFLCVAVNVADLETANIMAEALSADWAPTTPEEGVYVYDPTTNIASSKWVNGIKAW